MRYWITTLFLFAVVAGCGPALSKQDLGVVVFKDPKVAGSDKPYVMPQLSQSDESAAPSDDHGNQKETKPDGKG